MSQPLRMQSASGRQIEVSISGTVSGAGQVSPRILLPLAFSSGTLQLRLIYVRVELWCARELMGDGSLAGLVVRNHGATAFADIRTSHDRLAWMVQQLGSGSALTVDFKVSGAIQVRAGENDSWIDDELMDNGLAQQIQISRSEWYERVLVPIRQTDYVYLEVAVPRGAVAQRWQQAMAHLQGAEAAYATGDDDAVFFRLRGCLDALPGDKTHIYDSVPDPKKRDAVNKLMRQFGEFLHTGRHVADESSPAAGTFPVNHVDAGFAIAAMKVLLSYSSQLIANG